MTTKMALFPFWVFGKPVMKSILTLSHFHSGIGNGLRVPADLWCSTLTRRQTSHSAMNCVISLFILVHQNLWRRSRYIFVLPGWIERCVSCASLIISCLRFLFLGTTICFPKKTIHLLSVEKHLATPLAMFSLIRRTPRERLWATMIGPQGLVSPPRWKEIHEEQSRD